MRAISTATSVVRHALGAFGEALLVALIIATLLLALAPVYRPADFLAGTGDAAAAKGGRAASSSVAVVLVNDADGDGVPDHAETITFDVSTTATDRPYVNVRCYQGSAFVYDGWAGFFPGAWFGQDFTLSSPSWTAGAADCTARLVMFTKRGSERTLASLTFHVGG